MISDCVLISKFVSLELSAFDGECIVHVYFLFFFGMVAEYMIEICVERVKKAEKYYMTQKD